MEAKTREELALMGKEELEAVVLHLQDEVASLQATIKAAREMKNMFYERATLMESRLMLIQQLLKSWEMMK